MPGTEFITGSGFDFQMLSYYTNMLPSLIPILAMSIALVFSSMLFKRLKPGLVCELEESCFRCHLLYGLALGTSVFSFLYLVKEILFLADRSFELSHPHTFQCLSAMMMRAGVFLFLSWLCFKGDDCLTSNCLHKQKACSSDKESKPSVSIVAGSTCSCMCYPIEMNDGKDKKSFVKRVISKVSIRSKKTGRHEKRCPNYLKSTKEVGIHSR